MKHANMVTYNTILFLRKKIFCGPAILGAPGARGPLFIEPLEPPVSTPLALEVMALIGDTGLCAPCVYQV